MSTVRIKVNGAEHLVEEGSVSYDEILSLSQGKPGPWPGGWSIIYRSRYKGAGRRDGILAYGERVYLSAEKDQEMIFNVALTGGA